MHLLDLVDPLRAALGLPHLHTQADGSSAFRAQGIPVLLIPRPAPEKAFVIRSRLGPIGDRAGTDRFQSLMRANFFADGIGGAALSLDGRGDVYLTQHIPQAGLQFELFMGVLQRFITQALRGRDLLDPAELLQDAADTRQEAQVLS